MDRKERLDRVAGLRRRDIEGTFIILRPASERYAEDIVRLRNRPMNMHWFNQPEELTPEMQKEWFRGYEKTDDDIYWVILDKNERFIGTIRLYDIDPDGDSCDEGSCAIDEEAADEAPYAVEAKMLVFDTAFDELGIKRVINENLVDNRIMNNMDNQLGFDEGYPVVVEGAGCMRRELTRERFMANRGKLAALIDYWSRR